MASFDGAAKAARAARAARVARNAAAGATDSGARAAHAARAATSAKPSQPLPTGPAVTGEQPDTAADPAAKPKQPKIGAGVAKGALSGAAQGTLVGGAAGAAAGAAKGAAMALARNPKARKRLLGIVAVIVLPGLLVVGAFLSVTTSSVTNAITAMAGHREATAAEVATASGQTDQDIADAKERVRGTRVPWELLLAAEKATGDTVDVGKLSTALEDAATSDGDIALANGALYSTGSKALSIPDGDQAAERTRTAYVTALTTALGVDEGTAESIFREALEWHLGQGGDKCGATSGTAPVAGSGPGAGSLDAEQTANARVIIGIAKTVFAAAPAETQKRAAVVGIATARQESGIRNLPGGDRDSVGMFQQRPSAGWGSADQLLDPVYTSSRFFAALARLAGWESMPVTVAAQTVQVSAFPDAYAKWEDLATTTVGTLWDSSPAVPVSSGVVLPGQQKPGATPVVSCGMSSAIAGGFPLAPGSYRLGDGYGPRASECYGGYCTKPFHTGQDFVAECGTPLFAVVDGKITEISTGGSFGGFTELTGANGAKVWYAHQPFDGFKVKQGDTVKAGQQIGVVGSTGASSGCHLHMEVRVDGRAMNPMTWLQAGV